MLARMWRKGNPCAVLVGMQTGAATVESSVEIPQKIRNGTACDSAIPLLWIYLRKPKTLIQKNICTPMFTAALLTTARIWKQPKCPLVNEWVKQLWCIYTMERYLAVTKKSLRSETALMALENIMLGGISQSEKDKSHIISFICRI